jgi:sec-independent protein translocase protein TatA
MIGTTEWVVIGLVVMVLFGSAAIPKFARSLGKARQEFENGRREGEKKIAADKAADGASDGAKDAAKG